MVFVGVPEDIKHTCRTCSVSSFLTLIPIRIYYVENFTRPYYCSGNTLLIDVKIEYVPIAYVTSCYTLGIIKIQAILCYLGANSCYLHVFQTSRYHDNRGSTILPLYHTQFTDISTSKSIPSF